LFHHAAYWRDGLESMGFRVLPGSHPLIPVMLGEAPMAQAFAQALDRRGVMVSPFFYPVVPRGAARIRTQMNAALTTDDLDRALEAFGAAGREVRALR
jgi:glycine C-acetyltransferase